MTTLRHIAVIDIGKTNVKLVLVDAKSLTEIAVVTRPNTVLPGPPWPHFDVDGHWRFLLDGLAKFQSTYGIDAISITTHGASVVLLDHELNLAAPVLDYECDGPDKITDSYDKLRPAFDQTGSPRLAGGLNVGAQLHWQFQQDPDLLGRTAHVLTYPQYWGSRLTGQVACDVTSIGCHTDLWCPKTREFSDLVDKLGIKDKISPVRKSTDILGTVLPDIATRTGLSTDVPVAVGIHDSNASLYPHILTQDAPFSVVSTGTWVIVMSVGGNSDNLDPSRDTLLNVNALGDPVPSARFMGGREFELIQGGHKGIPTSDDITHVLDDATMILPAVEPSTGPFQARQMRWTGTEPALGTGQRATALSFYLAMMTDTCLSLTGAKGPTIVEGPFAHNDEFKRMLAAATGRPVLPSDAATGTAIGAALLFGARDNVDTIPAGAIHGAPVRWQAYADNWRAMANAPT